MNWRKTDPASGYRGDGSYADALLLATAAGIPVIGYGAHTEREGAKIPTEAVVSTIAELDKLPRFTVIRSDDGTVFERQTMWHEAGSRDLKYSPDIILPATVLQLGWGKE